jgi:hypothetical protein
VARLPSVTGCATPELAVRADDSVPPQYVRIVAVDHAPDGKHAAVRIEYNAPPMLEPCAVLCERTPVGWLAGQAGSAGGVSWMATDTHAGLASRSPGPRRRRCVGRSQHGANTPPTGRWSLVTPPGCDQWHGRVTPRRRTRVVGSIDGAMRRQMTPESSPGPRSPCGKPPDGIDPAVRRSATSAPAIDESATKEFEHA